MPDNHDTVLPDAEQTFFADPAIDRVLAMVMALAAELHVTRDRLRALEALMVRSGALDAEALDRFRPSVEEARAGNAERDSFAASLMACMAGRQASLGAPPDLLGKVDR